MPEETGAKIDRKPREAIKLMATSVKELDEAAGRAQEPGVAVKPAPVERTESARREPAHAASAESVTAAHPNAQDPVSRAATEALHAGAEQIMRERGANAGDAAALAQALRSFLDAFAGQNAPTRSEFRDLAARLDRLSSQYAKGR